MFFTNLPITFSCLWLSLQLLLGSVGLPIIEHYCGMSGKSEVSILTEKECCCDISEDNLAKLTQKVNIENTENHNAFENEITDSCCDTQTSYEKVDFEAISLQKTVFKFSGFVAILPSTITFKIYSEKAFFAPFPIFHFADLPPPNWKLGKLFIVFIQVFRL